VTVVNDDLWNCPSLRQQRAGTTKINHDNEHWISSDFLQCSPNSHFNWVHIILLQGNCSPGAARICVISFVARMLYNVTKPSFKFLGLIACMQCMRCGLLLQMSYVAWSVCLYVCVSHIGVQYKNGEPVKMTLTHVGPKNRLLLLDGVKIRRIHSQPR